MYKNILMVLVAGTLMGCGGGGGGGDGSNPYPAPPISDADKQAYMTAINNARAVQQDCHTEGIKAAVPALSWNDALYKAAYEHSEDMALSNTFAHEGSGTASDWTGMDLGGKQSTVQERIEHNGYSSWTSLGENITAGTTRDTAQKAVNAWLASDPHCANLMNPNFTEVGMGHVSQSGSTYTHYWTQDFGSR